MINKKTSARYQSIGLLILRVGLGVMFVLHGYPKLFGGPEMWKHVGFATRAIGLDFMPVVFGFLAGIIEFFGGFFLLLGLFFRPVIGFLLIVMVVATSTHIAAGDPFPILSHPIEVGIVFIALLFTGPGSYNLRNRLKSRKRRW